jgi:hypothetical protein
MLAARYRGVKIQGMQDNWATAVQAGGEMRFMGGAKLIYDSKSKSEDCFDNMNEANYRWLEVKHSQYATWQYRCGTRGSVVG